MVHSFIELDKAVAHVIRPLLTLNVGYLLSTATPDLGRGVSPHGTVPDLGHGVAPPGCRPWPQAWRSSSRLLLVTDHSRV